MLAVVAVLLQLEEALPSLDLLATVERVLHHLLQALQLPTLAVVVALPLLEHQVLVALEAVVQVEILALLLLEPQIQVAVVVVDTQAQELLVGLEL
jgi:hypothetical protein